MNKDEFDNMVESLKRSGLNEGQILDIFVKTFEQNECDIEDLEIMFGWLGYSLTDDFYKDHGLQAPKITLN